MPVTSTDGAPISDITDHYGVPLSDFRVVSSYDQIIQTVRNLGEGTRGIVFGARPDIGHVFNVVFDKNGVVFLDGQSGGFAELENFTQLRLLITKEV